MKPMVENMAAAVPVLLLLLWLGATTAKPIPLLTIQSPDGDMIECIRLKDQISFESPLLRNHILQDPPPISVTSRKISWQVWHKNGTLCPQGTISVRSIPDDSRLPTQSVAMIHEYATGFVNYTTKIYGTKATMSVRHPKIENGVGFSLGQIWLTSGSYLTNDLNTIEVGWQVFPQFYKDNQPRFFIFWTTDAYKTTHCYNLRCSGFIQTSRMIVIEGAIASTSTLGDDQNLIVKIWKDPSRRTWWLGVGFNDDILEPVGYWPTEIFTRLNGTAEDVQWGGEVTNYASGNHTKTQMGSGYIPERGSHKAAYMRNLEVAANNVTFQPIYSLLLNAGNPVYYGVEKSSNTSFYYGGPEHGNATTLRLGFVFLFLFFVILVFC